MGQKRAAEQKTAEDLADHTGRLEPFEQRAGQIGAGQKQGQGHQRHNDFLFGQGFQMHGSNSFSIST